MGLCHCLGSFMHKVWSVGCYLEVRLRSNQCHCHRVIYLAINQFYELTRKGKLEQALVMCHLVWVSNCYLSIETVFSAIKWLEKFTLVCVKFSLTACVFLCLSSCLYTSFRQFSRRPQKVHLSIHPSKSTPK